MMKKLILFFIYLFINLSCFSQSKEITLEKIWKEYSFYPKNINKFKSTKNGNHYLSLIKNNNGQEIIMSNYANGKKIKTLFKSAKFKIEKINDFKLSKNEEKILLFSKTNSIYTINLTIDNSYNITNNQILKIQRHKIFNNIIETPTSSNNGFVKNLITLKKYFSGKNSIYGIQGKLGNIFSLSNNDILTDK